MPRYQTTAQLFVRPRLTRSWDRHGAAPAITSPDRLLRRCRGGITFAQASLSQTADRTRRRLAETPVAKKSQRNGIMRVLVMNCGSSTAAAVQHVCVAGSVAGERCTRAGTVA